MRSANRTALRLTLLAGLTFSTACGSTPSARPQRSTWFKAGKRHYDQSEYAKARRVFAEGWEETGSADFLYYIALCHEAEGSYEEAIAEFKRFADTGRGPRQNEALLHVERLERRLRAENGR